MDVIACTFISCSIMQIFFLVCLYIACMCCRPSAIPGPVPDELVVPATESIGLCQLIYDSVFATAVYYANLNS